MNNYAIIKTAVDKVCPERLELKFGCSFVWKEQPRDYEEDGYVATFENWKTKNKEIRCLTHLGQQGIVSVSNITEILGSPITLSMILRTLHKSPGIILISSGGTLHMKTPLGHQKVCDWNLLHDDLRLQTPATQQAIAELLK